MYWHSLIDSAFGDCCGLVYVCYWWHFRFALQLSTRLRYRSLQSLLMLALCLGQSDGVDDFVPHGNIGVAEKENSWKQTSNCFFRPADVTMGKRSTAVTKGGRGYGDCASPYPATSPKNSWWLRLVWGRLVLTVRTEV